MADDEARALLDRLQAAIDSSDLDTLLACFDEPAVLIGTSGDGRDAEGLRRYLTAVAESEPFRWEWREIVPYHRGSSTLGFAAFGEIVAGDVRAPIRLTIFAEQHGDEWRIRQFHGSIPAG